MAVVSQASCGARTDPRPWGLWSAIALAVVGAVVGLWLVLGDRLPDAEQVSAWLGPYRRSWYAIPAAMTAFVVLPIVLIPVLGMSVAAGLVFGPWLGSACALAGCLLSATFWFAVGRRLGADVVQRVGGRMQILDRGLGRNGVVAVYLIRKVPAPFVLVNLVIGASRIRLLDFLVGTGLGMGALVVVLATAGARIGRHTAASTVWSIVAVLASLALAIAVNQWMKRHRAESRP